MNMVLSLVGLLGFTSYSIFRTYKRRRLLSCMAGMTRIELASKVDEGTIVTLKIPCAKKALPSQQGL